MGCMPMGNDRETGQKQTQGRTLKYRQPAVSLANSSILMNHTEHNIIINSLLCNVVKRLNVKSILSANLLFRASDHKFKTQQFRKYCCQQKYTVLIACTTENKYFGAFTPCVWKKDEIFTYQHDQNGSSFLFKVNEKNVTFYNVKQSGKQFAILNDSDCGPTFGEGHDINIVDECDKKESWNNIGKSYGNNFKYGSLKSNSQLCGCQKYKLKQYQIWQIQINQQNSV